MEKKEFLQEAETKPELEKSQEAEMKPELEKSQETEMKVELEKNQEAEMKPEWEKNQEAETKPEPEKNQEAEMKPEPEKSQETEKQPESEKNQEAEPKVETETKAEAETKPESKKRRKAKATEIPEIKAWREKSKKAPLYIKRWLWILAPVLSLLALTLTFLLTKTPIEKNDKKLQTEAYQAIFAEGVIFEEAKEDLKAADAKLSEAGYRHLKTEAVMVVKDRNQNPIGRIYQLSSQDGYGGYLSMTLGINGTGGLCGIEFNQIAKMVELTIKDEQEAFLDQFLYQTHGKKFWIQSEEFGGFQVQPMESAPVTSQAAVDIVNGCLLLDDLYGHPEGGEAND